MYSFVEGRMKSGEDEAILEMDLAKTAWLRAIVRRRGWPAKSSIGEDGARAAWLIAQRADATREF